MIFKTFDSNIDKWTSKIGIFGKSFNELGSAVNNAFKSAIDNIDNFDENIGFWESLKNNLFPKKEDKDWIKNSLGEIISQENINSYIAELDLSSAKNKLKEIFDWQEDVANGETTWEKFFDTCKGGNEYIIDLIKNTDDLSKLTGEDLVKANQQARNAAIAHNQEIKNMSLSAKAGQIVLKGLALAGNMIAMWAITKGIELAVKGIDELANSVDHCKERVENLMSSYQSALNTANNNASKAEELADKYETLSKGVNNLGENVSLTTDEYKEYNNIVNDIAEMFPTLVQGYTDEGNAILSLKGNVEQLRDAYKDAQQEAYNMLIASGEDSDGNDIIKQWEDTHDTGFWAKILDFGNIDVGKGISLDDAIKTLNAIKNMSYEDYWDARVATTNTLYDKLSEEQKYVHDNLAFLNDNLSTPSKDKDTYAQYQKEAKALVQTYTAEIDSALSDVETLANAYLMTNEDYAKLDEQSKNAASVIVNSLNADIASGFHSKEDVGAYVDGIVQMISSNTEAQDALVGLLSMDTTDMSVDRIQAAVDNYIKIIADALEEDPVELKTRLNFDDADTDAQKKKVQGFLKDEFDDKVGELTLEQLDTASKLKVSDGDLLSWDELIAKIQEAKDEASETAASAPISIDEAWLSLTNTEEEELKNLQKDLSELAKTGRLTEETFHETTGADTFLDKIGISAKEAIQWINQLQTAADQVASMKNGISSITDALGKKQEGETIGADTLAGFDSTFKQLEYWEEFESIMGDSTSTMEECQNAANKLATAWVNNSNFLANLTEKNKNAYESMLTQMGVANANEIVTSALAEKVNLLALEEQFAKDTGKALTDATNEEINSFLQAQNASDSLKTALYQLALQKELTNGVTLDFSSDIDKINELVTKIGGATRSLQILQQIKEGKANYIPTSEYDKIVAGAQQEVDKALETKGKKTKVKVTPTSTPSSKSGGSSSKTSKTSNKTVIDWISKKLDRLNDKISLTQAKYENLVDTLGKKRGKKKKKFAKNSDGLLEAQIENLDEQIKLYDKLAKNEKTAIKRYDKKAKSVKLSSSLKKKVRNGKIGTKKTSMKTLIHTYGEKNAKKIQEYEQWYDAARNAEKDYESARASSRKKTEEKYQIQADAAQAKISMYQSQAANAADDYKTQNGYLEKQRELIKKNYDMQIAIANLNKDTVLAAELQAQKAEELAQLEKQKFDNIQADFENRRSTYQMQMDIIEARNNLLEAKGQKIQASSYENEIKQEQGMLETYKAEKAELEKQIKTIPKGTEEWYRAKEAINKCDVEIINCTASAAELNNKITEIANNAKSALQTAFATMASEGDLYAELMSNKDMFNSETGIITKEGLATLGTYGNGYNVTKASAEMDHSLIKMLQAGLNHDFNKSAYSFIDSNDEERVYNSLEQLEDAIKEVYEDWREQIKNTFEYESKIIDMMRDKLENELSAIKELIDAKKDALSAEKALHDYRKSIKESTENISSLQKQIIAVQGDTSESGIARIQKLQNELKQQEQALEEQEFDHLIQAEQDMLDNLYDEYSDLITNEMQDTRKLLDKGFEMIESSTGTINQTIKDYSGIYGYTPEYNNHMNSGSGDILNDAKGEDSRRSAPSLAELDEMAERAFGNAISLSETKEQKPKEEKPKETKSSLISVPIFTKDELKKLKPKVEKIFDNKKLYKKGKSDGTAINNFLYKENGKILTSKALEKLRKICGTNDNDTMFGVIQSISKTIGDIKNVKGFKDGGIAKVIKSNGEDGLIMARNGEGFVKPEHVGEVKKLLDALPQLNAAMNYQIDMPKMPDVKPVQVSPNQVVEIGNVTLPNVTNYEEFKTQMFKDMQKDTKFEKMLQSMTISKIATPQHNRFSKNSIRF